MVEKEKETKKPSELSCAEQRVAWHRTMSGKGWQV